MTTTHARRGAAVGALTLATACLGLLLAAPAFAETEGILTVSPPSGADDTPLSVTTSSGCNGNGTNYQVRIVGSGFAPENASGTGGTSVTNNIAQPSGNGPITAPLNDTLRSFAAQQSPPVDLAGDYVLKLICRSRLTSDNIADFRATINFTGSAGSKRFTTVTPTQSTATSLAASPASPQPRGTSVSFTATVDRTGAPGQIQFFNNGSPLGSPVTPTPGTPSSQTNGSTQTSTAVLTTDALPVGVNNITATFTPTNTSQFAASTSNSVPYTTTAAAPEPVIPEVPVAALLPLVGLVALGGYSVARRRGTSSA